jgi:hypothetical protein
MDIMIIDNGMIDRSSVDKMIEQELAGILLQAIKVAQKEEKPEVKDAFQIILRVIDSRRSMRETAGADDL